MKKYIVKWEIDIDAKNPLEAAKMALKVQRDPGSTAVVFEVQDAETGNPSFHLIDLQQEQN